MMQVPQVPPCIGVVSSQRIRASLETSMTLHTDRVSHVGDHALQGDIFQHMPKARDIVLNVVLDGAVLNVPYDSGFVDGLFQVGNV